MPDLPKEFPQMMNMNSAPPSAQGSQINALDRNVSQSQQTQQQQTSAGSGPQPQQEQSSQLTQTQSTQSQQLPPQLQSQSLERNHDGDIEPQQLTAIFRPDDAGEWKERLRMSHEAAERERLERTGESQSFVGAASWERGGSDDEHSGGKDVDEEDEEESTTSFGESSETDGAKLWKVKRTLRK